MEHFYGSVSTHVLLKMTNHSSKFSIHASVHVMFNTDDREKDGKILNGKESLCC